MNTTKVTASSLAGDAVEFLAFKRAMGRDYRSAESVLNGFVRFVGEHYGERPAPLEQVVTRWATGGAGLTLAGGADGGRARVALAWWVASLAGWASAGWAGARARRRVRAYTTRSPS